LADYSSYGVNEINDLLGGGLITGSSYLLEAEPGTGGLAFIASFLDAGWHQQELCTVISYDIPHEYLIKRLAQFVDIKEKMDTGTFDIVDFRSEAHADYELNGPIWMTNNPKDLNSTRQLTFELASRIPERIQRGAFKGIRYVTYSLSSMIMNYKFEPTYKWNDVGLNIARQHNLTALSVIDPRMFDETVVAAFEHLHDGVIVLSMRKQGDRFQRYIRIKQSPIVGFSTKIVPYDIVDMRPHIQKLPD
jgi:KaiC/GvpD/RAD55 family RecA-like ATPase